MSAPRNEQKYFMLKLIHSGRTLSEAKALMYAVSAGLHPEYTKSGDLNDLQTLEGGLHRISQTRKQAQHFSYKKYFKPRKDYPSTREEALAKWVTGWRGGIPMSWKRDGNLVRRGPPNKPKPGSSKGKIGTTKVVGVKGVLNDFKMLFNTLANLQKKHGKGNMGALRTAYKSVRTSVTSQISKS